MHYRIGRLIALLAVVLADFGSSKANRAVKDDNSALKVFRSAFIVF